MFPAIMYVLHLEKHKMQKIKNHNIKTEKQAYRLPARLLYNDVAWMNAQALLDIVRALPAALSSPVKYRSCIFYNWMKQNRALFICPANYEGALCFNGVFTRTFFGNEDVTVKKKSEVIYVIFWQFLMSLLNLSERNVWKQLKLSKFDKRYSNLASFLGFTR